jgi:hypothetical protein
MIQSTPYLKEKLPITTNLDTFRPDLPGTPEAVAQAFEIPDEARENPLIQAFLERRSRRVSAVPVQSEPRQTSPEPEVPPFDPHDERENPER